MQSILIHTWVIWQLNLIVNLSLWNSIVNWLNFKNKMKEYQRYTYTGKMWAHAVPTSYSIWNCLPQISSVVLSRFGRKPATISYLVIRVVGIAMSSFAPNYPTLAVGRFILGVGTSGCFLTAYVLSECSIHDHVMGVFHQVDLWTTRMILRHRLPTRVHTPTISLAPSVGLGIHQNIRLHTGARANVVSLTHLLYDPLVPVFSF